MQLIECLADVGIIRIRPAPYLLVNAVRTDGRLQPLSQFCL